MSFDLSRQGLLNEVTRLDNQIKAVRVLHRPTHGDYPYDDGLCNHCSNSDGDMTYPCPTIRALDGEQ